MMHDHEGVWSWMPKKAAGTIAVGFIALGATACDGNPMGPGAPTAESSRLSPSLNAAALPAIGTVTQTGVLSEQVRFAGPNTIVELTVVATIAGTLSGTVEDAFRLVIHPNGKFTAQGTSICDCTIGGKSGTVELRLTDTGEIVGGVPHFSGRWVILDATGELAGLHGVLQVNGAVDVGTNLSSTDYSGWIRLGS